MIGRDHDADPTGLLCELCGRRQAKVRTAAKVMLCGECLEQSDPQTWEKIFKRKERNG